MRLESFRVTNFRSINDSGEINVSRITALLGRNESGKSNLLRGLHSLNPAEGFKALDPVKDFPRHRRLEECTDDTPAVSSTWTLDAEEQQQLAAIWPRAVGVARVEVSRRYNGKHRYVTFLELGAQAFNEADIIAKVKKIAAATRAAADKLEEAAKTRLDAGADAFENALAMQADRAKWGEAAVKAVADLRKALASCDADLSDKQEQLVSDLDAQAAQLANERQAHQAAINWVVETLPVFLYLDEYPELSGHQDIAQYVERKQKNGATESDRAFSKLCKVAGLDPEKLHAMLARNEHESRNQLANRAGAVVTSEIRKSRPRLTAREPRLDGQAASTFPG